MSTPVPPVIQLFNLLTRAKRYHEGEGRFDDSGKPSEAGTPVPTISRGAKKRTKKSNKKKTTQERLNMIDGNMDVSMGGM